MKKLILTVCLAATGVFGAAAQMRLTLGEALDLALSENPTVKVAGNGGAALRLCEAADVG